MRVILNLIWLVFGGLALAFAYAVVALIMFVLIITIPFGIASARIALFCLWPFGRTIVRRADAGGGPGRRRLLTSSLALVGLGLLGHALAERVALGLVRAVGHAEELEAHR